MKDFTDRLLTAARNIITRAKDYLAKNERAVKTTLVAFGGVIVVAGFIALYIYNVQSRQVKIDYQPISACSLLNHAEAKALLGDDAIDNNNNQATVSGNRAVSKCAYTGGSVTTVSNNIAVAVKSAVNDQGVQDNKDDFAISREANKVELVSGVGDEAFYTPANGQLSVLYGRIWILISFGTGTDVSTYTLENALKVADKVLDTAS